MTTQALAEDVSASSPVRWDLVGLALVVTLSLTDVSVARVGNVPVTLFLIACVVAVPTFLLRWNTSLQWFGLRPVALWIVINSGLNLGAAKGVSVVYSFIFLAAFLTIANCQKFISRESFAAALRLIIAAYFVNVLISRVLVLVGAPDDFLGFLFHRAIDTREGVGLRYYGFSSEPSYAAFIVVACFVSLRQLSPASDRRRLLVYAAMVAYQLILFASIYGYLLGLATAVAEMYRMMRRGTFLVVITLAASTALVMDVQGEGRFEHLASAAATQDIDGIASLHVIDSSLFLRTAPAIEYVQSANVTSPDFWVGHGAMTSTSKYTEMFAGWIGEDDSFMASFLPGFFYDFGLIGGMLVILLILRRAGQRVFSLANLVLFAVVFNASFNTQLFWFVIAIFVITKRLAQQPEALPT